MPFTTILRVNSFIIVSIVKREFMGLTTFKGDLPTLSEAKLPRTIWQKRNSWAQSACIRISRFCWKTGRARRSHDYGWLGDTCGSESFWLLEKTYLITVVSSPREQMKQKVDKEYKSYQAKTLSQVEKDYLKEIKSIENLAKEGGSWWTSQKKSKTVPLSGKSWGKCVKLSEEMGYRKKIFRWRHTLYSLWTNIYILQ